MITKAPGKVMIAGEYSVLCGGKALVAAINCTALCSFSPGPKFAFLAITHTEEYNDHHPLFVACMNACSKASIKPLSGHYTLDTSAFYEGHRKIGLGSSAAAVAALTKMVLLQNGIVDQNLLFNIAFLAHQQFSLGLGSGADVAASVFGGIISYKLKNHIPLITPVPHRALDELLFIDTGLSQDTRPLVKQFLSWANKAPSSLQLFSKNSSLLCEQITQLQQPNTPLLIDIIEQFFWLLADLGDMAGINIASITHQKIHALAKEFGGSAKPSGAGGGDIALAIVPKKHRQAFQEELAQQGFMVQNLSMAH